MFFFFERFTVRSVHRDDRGATAIEYTLIGALISVGLVASLTTIKSSLNTTYGCVASKVDVSTGGAAATEACSNPAPVGKSSAEVAQAYLLTLFPGKQPNVALIANRTGAVNVGNGILFSDLGAMSMAADGSWFRSNVMSNSVDGSAFQFGSSNAGYGNDGQPGGAGSYHQLATDPNVFVSNFDANYVLYKGANGYYGLILQ